MGILLELQARGELRAEDLAQTFEVSVRTIYRDVEALSETGVPVVATPGKGYRLMDGYFLPPVSFTADEAALLMLGGELVRDRVDPGLRQAAEEALKKLAGVLPPERREAMEQRRQGLAFARFTGRPDDRRLVLARRAIDERRVAHLVYHALHRAAPEPRDVEPIRLVFLGEAWHLIAYCRLRQGVRLFRLDRIDRLELLEERYVPASRHEIAGPNERDLGDLPEARVRFDPSILRWVREHQPFVLLREEAQATGPVFVYALRNERELMSWLLRWGSDVEVLEPDWLRARLAQEARLILARHATPAAERIAAPLTAT
ncbi:MAG: YafY family transcriptional regulator [Chloroflexi bacterium]|nr:YafY family transcriptional regulator [Chloroflexota bacterium]